ncbi:MAG: multicopper oxidase domain-containing protein [Caldilineaceae bacterium]|jgi:FtsP/CotA-like multicopper oxidase with cupredoxin domain|nr:multicopper oxidase domain-containing protein [Caldilineaceae bacterium]
MMTKFIKQHLWIGVLALLLAMAFHPQPAMAQAPDVTFELCATTGSTTLPDATTLPVWGYTLGACAGNPTVTQSGGPVLTVTQGDVVQVTLNNRLPAATGIFFHGQALPLDRTGAPSNSSVTYTFTAGEPGIFLYEAGLLPGSLYQTAMGLHGALIVRPATPNQAYNNASTGYNVEAVLVLSEIDPALNTSAAPASFNMSNFATRYELINGVAYPATAPITVAAGDRVLLRYVNAGALHHSMGLLGLTQQVIATDGNLRSNNTSTLSNAYTVIAETVAPGATLDAIATVPASTPAGARFAVHAGSLMLHNNRAAGYGGMMTFVEIPTVGPGGGNDATGPVAANLALTANGGDIIVSAQLSDADSGASNISAAEFVLDDTMAAPTAMAADDGAFDAPTEAVNGTIPASMLQTLTPGNHSVYVRGQDSAGNWGAYNLVLLSADNAGPATSALTLSPNPSQGNVNVALGGTASDAGSGNSNIVAAEYYIGAVTPGAGVAMGLNVMAPVASITATIPSAALSALPEGVNTISVRSQDATGLWGAPATIDLLIDRSGPATSNVTVAPSPNNGATGINPSRPAVRVDARVTEPGAGPVASNILRVEGFIGLIGADGAGFPFTPIDGLYDSPAEDAYAFIPLINLSQLAEGAHQIAVHGQDIAGNWGMTSTATLLIDRTPPTVNSVAVTPNPTNSASSVSLTASTVETLTTVSAAEWFVGADPGQGNGAAMTLTPNANGADLAATVDVSTWLTGGYVLSVRTRDAAGNWSLPVSVTLSIDDLLFTDSFESGGVGAWSASTGAVNVTPGAAMNGGAWGMQVAIAPGAMAYVTDATPDALTSYGARFYFHPNGSRAPNAGVTIFAALNASNNTVFAIQYRRPNPASAPQIRGVVMRAGGATNTGWVTLANAPQAVEVVWQSGNSTSFALYVDGVRRQVRNNLNTSAYTLESVRMGPVAGLAGTLTGTQYFDEFTSKRSTTTIFGP